MIFFCDNTGTIIKSIRETVNQGSANSNTIYLVAPFAQNMQVTVAFTLPNGQVIPKATMSQELITSEDGQSYYAYTYALPNTITQYYGKVTVQFYFYAAETGVVTATTATTFIVTRGVPSVLPPEPSDDIYEQILAILSSINSDLQNGTYVARSVFPWQSTTIYGENEIVFVPSEGEFGAIVRSLQPYNMNHAPYTNGVLNTLWWAEVVDFNTLSSSYFQEVQNAVEEAQNAAKEAQEAATNLTKPVRFVDSVSEVTDADVLYGVVSNADTNLFDLYMLQNGVPTMIGSANIAVNYTKYYLATLTAGGWQNGSQTVFNSDIDQTDDVCVSPVASDADVYVKSGVQATALIQGGITFTCTTTPTETITLMVGVTTTTNAPNGGNYYTKTEVDQLFSDYASVVDEELILNNN